MPKPVIITTPSEMRKWTRQQIQAGKTVGFVPTMGALHAGHRALIERARAENGAVVVSIYVNPTQFGPEEDFDKYPRTPEADYELCGAAGADVVFAPKDLYHENGRVWVEVGELGDKLCGMSRPGHFRGVATVVTKLFGIVRPDRAYFGKKDAQQLLIIARMVLDLDLGVEIVPCETVREPDGLAMSSRNRYLTSSERQQALSISKALKHCAAEIGKGRRDGMTLLGEMAAMLVEQPDIEIDYIALVDTATLEDLDKLKGSVLAAIAAKVGNTRLIDNIRFDNLGT